MSVNRSSSSSSSSSSNSSSSLVSSCLVLCLQAYTMISYINMERVYNFVF